MTEIKSPLRYPGGKAKAVRFLSRFAPDFDEYREPFVGGGSMFVFLKQQFPRRSFWINDLNVDLYCFWKYAQSDNAALARETQAVKDGERDGKALFRRLTKEWDDKRASDFDRAARFFILNRITFSGTVDSGGYSQKAFESRFTDSAIKRLSALEKILDGVTITNEDYASVTEAAGSNVFLFLDPPYLSAAESRLYGKRGVLHRVFDHERFAQAMRNCPHKWLATYDDSAEIRKNFSFAFLEPWEFQYGMNNYKQPTAAKGKELLLTNYRAAGVRREAELPTLALF